MMPNAEHLYIDGTDLLDRPAHGVMCEWFALCANLATKFRMHPILGWVPICERCDEKVEALK